MEEIALFGDIHANLPALQAVWADMDARGLERRFCLGDLVGYGVQPNEVVAHIRRHCVPTLMGNYDQGVGQNSDDCGCAYRTPEARALGARSIAWTNGVITADHRRYLRNLPLTMGVRLGRLALLLVHGSPRRINEYLYEDRTESSVLRLFAQSGADVIICGHTHLPYDRPLPGGKRLINAGSVGKPKDNDPRAGYLRLAVDGADISVEFIRVPYDVERAAAAIEATEMPAAFAKMLRQGQG